jgi:hypothetical protein
MWVGTRSYCGGGAVLRVRLLGDFAVKVDGREVADAAGGAARHAHLSSCSRSRLDTSGTLRS